jgi:hypothetical protein
MLDYILEAFTVSNSQACKFRYRNGSKSIRLAIRYSPSDSKTPEDIVTHFADILRYALGVSLST